MARHVAIFGFERPPFSTSGRSGLVLATAPVRGAAARIRSDLDKGGAWLCVGGAPGIGKSSLLRVLPRMLGDSFHCVAMRAAGPRLAANAEERIAAAFTLEGPRPVLLVDDADHLSPAALELLAGLRDRSEAAGRARIQLVVSADLQKAERATWSPLMAWADPLWILRIEPLAPDAMYAYLEKRLRYAGWKGRSLFTETAALAVHRLTRGNPGAVSRLCSQLLDEASAQGIHSIDAGFVLHREEAGTGFARGAHALIRKKARAPEPSPNDDAVLARSPLTAESIRNAPSLELAD
jgi:type II secretory pathway predicted ATPase ExeA